MKVRITSDGITTRVVNSDTGEVIRGITVCQIVCRVNEPVKVYLECLPTSIDMIGESQPMGVE